MELSKNKTFRFKFRRQHPYSIYVLDFYCHSLKLVIEVEGSIHDLEEIKRNDEIRQKHLEQNGLTVIRFLNEHVKLKPEEVIQQIESMLKEMIERRNNSMA